MLVCYLITLHAAASGAWRAFAWSVSSDWLYHIFLLLRTGKYGNLIIRIIAWVQTELCMELDFGRIRFTRLTCGGIKSQ